MQPSKRANATVHIRVLDTNDNAPTCSSRQHFNISDEPTPHQLVGRTQAIDPDEGENGEVSFRAQRYNDEFEVKANGKSPDILPNKKSKNIAGDILVRRPLNSKRLIRDVYFLAVIVEDGGVESHATVCSIKISVKRAPSDVTLLTPIESTLEVDPSCAVGCALLRINASDVARWEIERDGSAAAQFFDVEDGLIRLARAVDDEAAAAGGAGRLFGETLAVRIFDAREQQRRVTFNVQRVARAIANETLRLRVAERASIGTRLSGGGGGISRLGARKVYDAYFALSEPVGGGDDHDRHLSYALDFQTKIVEVDAASGAIFLAASLNSSAALHHTFVVTRRAAANGVLLNATTVTLDVARDETRAAPRFNASVFTIQLSESMTTAGECGGEVRAKCGEKSRHTNLNKRLQLLAKTILAIAIEKLLAVALKTRISTYIKLFDFRRRRCANRGSFRRRERKQRRREPDDRLSSGRRRRARVQRRAYERRNFASPCDRLC